MTSRTPRPSNAYRIFETILRRKLIIVLLALAGAGAAVAVSVRTNAVARVEKKIERYWLILTGGLVDVGGYRLRVKCIGKGNPTIVMDAGLNQTLQSWGDAVTEETAKFARVCIYERAGVGESDRSPNGVKRTSGLVVEELRSLLKNAGEKGPFLFVGHSLGGINIRLYASRYPDEVSGLLLVDSSHEDQYLRFASLMAPDEREKYLRHEGGGNGEKVDILASAEEVRKAPPLPDVPLIVLTASDAEPADNPARREMHREMQSALSRLLPNARQIIAAGSGHFIQLDRPDLVVGAVKSLQEQAEQRSNN